jgi:hypothetical protein
MQRPDKVAAVPVVFSLTDEQREMQELARDFARREIRPVAAEYDEREEMPWPVLEKAAKQHGFLSYGFPEAYGGGGVPDGGEANGERPRAGPPPPSAPQRRRSAHGDRRWAAVRGSRAAQAGAGESRSSAALDRVGSPRRDARAWARRRNAAQRS